MRLSEEEKETLKGVVRQVFGKDTIMRLFGSRVDDRRKGGDINAHGSSADNWSRLSLLRNKLAYEYPMDARVRPRF